MLSDSDGIQIPRAKREYDGVEVHIDNVGQYRGNFLCIECGEKLSARRGDKRKHYFAHYPGLGKECGLRSKEGVEDLERRANEHPDRYRKTCSKIPRGSIAISVNNNKAKVWCRLSPLCDEFDFDSENVKITVNGNQFNPLSDDISCDGDIYLEVKPGADTYTVTMEGELSDEYPKLQETRGIKNGDIFIISSNSNHYADRVEYSSCSIDYGDVLYLVDTTGNIALGKTDLKLSVYEIDENNIDKMEQELKLKRKTTTPFSTDIVLPAFINPSTKRSIGIIEGDSVIIGVHSKKITFVETIDFENNEKKEIPIRDSFGFLVKESVVKSDYFSIHWGSNQQEMSIVSKKDKQVFKENHISIYIDQVDINELNDNQFFVSESMIKNLSEHLIVRGADPVFNYSIELNDGLLVIDTGTVTELYNISKRFSSMMKTLTFGFYRSKRYTLAVFKLTDDSIKDVIRTIGIPEKINKTYIKRIMTELKMIEEPGGFPKKVRKIVEALKDE